MIIVEICLILFGLFVKACGSYLGIVISVFSFVGLIYTILEKANVKIESSNISNLFSQGDIVGKNLKEIESYLGKHSTVNISNDNKRVYSWEDYFEIICDENNVCIEVLKNNYDN